MPPHFKCIVVLFSVRKVIYASKADDYIFRSMVDPLLTSDLAIPSDFLFMTPGYLAITRAAVSGFNLLLLLWLAHRLQPTSAAVAAILGHMPLVIFGIS